MRKLLLCSFALLLVCLLHAQDETAPAPLWAFSVGNCTRPAGEGLEGVSGPTSIQSHDPAAYNTGANFDWRKPHFFNVDEVDFSFNYQHRIGGRLSRFSINAFAFKEKLEFDSRHYNNEAPLHTNVGVSMNSNYWRKRPNYKFFGSITGGGGGILGAPRFDPGTSQAQVIHQGAYLLIPPNNPDAPRYWLTGMTETLVAKIYLTLGRNLCIYIGGRATLSEFFPQASTVGTIPSKILGSVGGEYGVMVCFP
jgi:hypothetical protein